MFQSKRPGMGFFTEKHTQEKHHPGEAFHPARIYPNSHRICLLWFQPTPLKNDGVKVSWDDEILN